MSVKHSGVIVIPIAVALVAADLWMGRDGSGGEGRRLAKSAGTLAVIFLIAVACLSVTYGLRYWPRPNHMAMTLSFV